MASYVRSTMRSAVQEQNPYAARQAPGRRGWEVSRLPGPVLDRATAITAMLVAGTAGERDLPAGHLTSSVPCSPGLMSPQPTKRVRDTLTRSWRPRASRLGNCELPGFRRHRG